MPGNVPLASPSLVLPFSLCKSYARASQWAANVNVYSDGSSQRGLLVASGRNTWSIGKRLTPSQMATLRTFYNSVLGPGVAFYFYELYENSFAWDATGVATVGRYTVRFGGPLPTSGSFPRVETQFSLVEIA